MPSPSGVASSLLEEVREQLHVEHVDLGDLLDPLRLVAVVGQRMVRIGHADLRIGPQAALAAEHHRRDAREVGLERDHLQVEHQLHVVRVERPGCRAASRRRAAGRACRARPSRCAARSRGPTSGTRPSCGGPTRPSSVESALASVRATASSMLRRSRRRRARVAGSRPRVERAEQPLEDQPRIGLRRHRRRRAAPREAVGVGAAVARIAVADRPRVVAPELERRQTVWSARVRGGDLIDGDAVLDVAARRLLAGARRSGSRRRRARGRRGRRRARSRSGGPGR